MFGNAQDRFPNHDKTSARQLEYAVPFAVLSALTYYLIDRRFAMDIPTGVHIFASMGISAVITTLYARRQIRKRMEKQAKIKLDYTEMMDVNTQKYIDAMLRDNSKIPKVKR